MGAITDNMRTAIPQIFLFAAFFIVSFSQNSYAASYAGPMTCNAAYEAVIIYNEDENVLQYCNGTDWVSMGPDHDWLSTLVNPNPNSNDYFGSSVAVDGSKAVVGAWGDNPGAGANTGQAYVMDATTGTLITTLVNPNPTGNDRFGESVGIDGNIAIVGAQGDDPGAGGFTGQAYTFNATTGALIATLVNPNPTANDSFGISVAIDGNTAVVGAQGEGGLIGQAYTFNATTGALIATLANPGPVAGDRFGNSVAISGNNVVVGASNDAVTTGEAYVMNATTGALITTLVNPNANAGDYFGASVAIEGNTALVGANGENPGAGVSSGQAYTMNATTGALIATLVNPNGSASDHFGIGVSLSGNLALVGARGENPGTGVNTGQAYVMNATTGALITTLANPNATNSDNFGNGVAIDGNTAVVGAYGEDPGAVSSAGQAYGFSAFSGGGTGSCTNPAGEQAEMDYNEDEGQLQYCNGADWIAMGPQTTMGGPMIPGTISAGHSHSCGIGTNGRAYCWGEGTNGKLGNNATAQQNEPVEVHAGEGPGTFTQVSASRYHSCGIATNGRAYCWGEAADGKLGNNDDTTDQDEPVEVHAGEGPGTFTQVAAGQDHTCGLATDDRIYCWGQSQNGRLGNNDATTDQDEPVEVHAGEGPGTFTQVAGLGDHSCGLGTNGRAYCWGRGGGGRLGNNLTADELEPVEVHAGEGPGTFTQVSGGLGHTCGIGTDDKAYCWGYGFNGRLGNNDAVTEQHEPVEVHAGEGTGDFTQVFAGYFQGCGIGTNGKAYCWGNNGVGQLGNNTTAQQNEPVEVHAGEGTGDFTQVSTGNWHSCGTGTNGKAYCWGESGTGQLGDNQTATDQDEPVEVHAGEGAGDFISGRCASPAGIGGEIVYNDDINVMQYCNGVEWIGINDVP